MTDKPKQKKAKSNAPKQPTRNELRKRRYAKMAQSDEVGNKEKLKEQGNYHPQGDGQENNEELQAPTPIPSYMDWRPSSERSVDSPNPLELEVAMQLIRPTAKEGYKDKITPNEEGYWALTKNGKGIYIAARGAPLVGGFKKVGLRSREAAGLIEGGFLEKLVDLELQFKPHVPVHAYMYLGSSQGSFVELREAPDQGLYIEAPRVNSNKKGEEYRVTSHYTRLFKPGTIVDLTK